MLDGGWTTEHRPQSSRWDKHPASICKQQDQSGERREGPHSELPGVRLWGRTGALHWIQFSHGLGLDSDVLEANKTEENALNIHYIDNFFKSVWNTFSSVNFLGNSKPYHVHCTHQLPVHLYCVWWFWSTGLFQIRSDSVRECTAQAAADKLSLVVSNVNTSDNLVLCMLIWM